MTRPSRRTRRRTQTFTISGGKVGTQAAAGNGAACAVGGRHDRGGQHRRQRCGRGSSGRIGMMPGRACNSVRFAYRPYHSRPRCSMSLYRSGPSGFSTNRAHSSEPTGQLTNWQKASRTHQPTAGHGRGPGLDSRPDEAVHGGGSRSRHDRVHTAAVPVTRFGLGQNSRECICDRSHCNLFEHASERQVQRLRRALHNPHVGNFALS